MNRQTAAVHDLIEQLYELGFLPSQVNSIILNTAGSLQLNSLPAGKLQKLAKELENCVWFSRRCRSIG